MEWSTWDPSTKVIAKIILAGLGLGFLWVVKDLVILLLFAVVLASALEPLVGYLKIRRVPRTVSVLAVYALFIGVVILVVSLLVPVVASQFRLLTDNLPQYTNALQNRFPTIQNLLGTTDLSQFITHSISEFTTTSSVYSKTLGVVDGFVSIITVLVVSFYLVAEQQGMISFINSLVPSKHRGFVAELVIKIQARMGRWILGQLILSVCVFVLTYIGLTALGVHYALFLALIAGLFEIVPYLGTIAAALPAVFFAFVQSPPLAVAVIILYVIIHELEAYVLVPKVMQRTIGTSPLLVLVALLVGFKFLGVLGLLLGIPLVSVITLLVEELSNNSSNNATAPASETIIEETNG